MTYQVLILPRTRKVLEKLPSDIYQAVKHDMISLGDISRPVGCKKLVNRPGWRIRTRNYRIIYEINDKVKTVTILDVDHRKDIYR